MRTALILTFLLIIQTCLAQAAPQFVAVGGLGLNKTLIVYRFDNFTGLLYFEISLENYQAPNWLTWQPNFRPSTLIVGNRKKGVNGTSKLTAVSWETIAGVDGTLSGKLANIPGAFVETIDPAHLLASTLHKSTIFRSIKNNNNITAYILSLLIAVIVSKR